MGINAETSDDMEARRSVNDEDDDSLISEQGYEAGLVSMIARVIVLPSICAFDRVGYTFNG